MNLTTRPMLSTIAIGAISFLLVGCSTTGAVVTEPPATSTPSEVTAPPVAGAPGLPLAAVSASRPTAEAAGALAKCHIGDMIPMAKVSGMAKIPSAVELPHYVPFTGREPQLKVSGSVWVVQIRGDVQQRGNEIWTNPTCVVTSGEAGFFATGPVTNTATGKTVQPEAPPAPPDRPLPPLAP
jgi:hypothetical protein